MSADGQSRKLKQRLSQWQSYIEHERSQLKDPQEKPEAGKSGAYETEYRERLTELNALLQEERARTERLTTQLCQEVLRRRQSASPYHGRRAFRLWNLRIFKAMRPGQKTSGNAAKYLWLRVLKVFGLSVLAVGLFRLLVVILEVT